MHVVHERRGERQQVARQVLHLLRHLHPRHALAHQRLVHVDVEQPHLGVGDLRQRLAIHARELQEGHEREARGEHRRRRTAAPARPRRSGSRAPAPAGRCWSRSARSAPARDPVASAASSTVRRCGRRGTSPRRSRRRAGPPPSPRGSRRGEWPRSRRRATIRACATAAAVQPSPSACGITPVEAQRLSVAGDTPARSAASLRVSVWSVTRPDATTAESADAPPLCAGEAARVVGRRRDQAPCGGLRPHFRP